MKSATQILEVTLTSGPRYNEMVRVLGHARFPVRSAAPINAKLNSRPAGAPAIGAVFLVDTDLRDADNLPVVDLPLIEEHLTEKFGLRLHQVQRFIERTGLPLLAVGCETNFERKPAVEPGFFASVWI